ncbi:MAG: hypothetical protein ACI4IG_00405 [Eubacterium sp.]
MKRSVIAVFLSGTIIMLTAMSGQVKQGAIQGINLCIEIIIPALLPILILTNMIMKSSGASFFESLFGWFVKGVLRLPKCASCAVLFGLVGGYPAGTVLTASLFEQGLINENEAKRIMSFNFCGGLAFIVTAVGEICLGSKHLGLIMYLSNILSALIIAVIAGLFGRKQSTITEVKQSYLSLSDAMVDAVDSTIDSILIMCAYIILFSACTSMITLPSFISPLLEITNGICINASRFTIPQCSAYLSFGGLCIHFQLLSFFKKMKINYIYFLVCRIISALLSYGITLLYFQIFPKSAQVFSNMSSGVTVSATQVNAGLSTIMIIGCAVLIFDIEGKKIKLS